MTDSKTDIIKHINNTPVSAEDIFRVLDESDKYHQKNPGDKSFEAGMFIIAQIFRGNPQKAIAVHARMFALSIIIEEGSIPGWTLDRNGKEGYFMVSQEILNAVAEEPLIFRGENYYFDVESLKQRALLAAETEGNA